MLKASNIAFTLGCIFAAVSNKVWPQLIVNELFSLNLLSIFSLIVNFAIIGLVFSISIFWCLYSQDSDCFVLNSYFFQNQFEIYLGNSAVTSHPDGYSRMLDHLPNLLSFLKNLALSANDTKYLSILHQIDWKGAESLTLEQREYVIKGLNANYLYHYILLYNGTGYPYKEYFLIQDCVHYLILLDETKWTCCIPLMSIEDLNIYFK